MTTTCPRRVQRSRPSILPPKTPPAILGSVSGWTATRSRRGSGERTNASCERKIPCGLHRFRYLRIECTPENKFALPLPHADQQSDSVKKFRYWLEWFFVAGFAWLAPLIPLGFLRILADFAGAIFYLADRRSRAVALANLEAVFGAEMSEERRRQVARKSLQVFARSFLELFWSPRLNRKNVEKFISFENPEAFRPILATKQESPTIGITPHFGNFEWGSALFAFRDYEGYILTQKFKNERLTPIFQRIRERSGHRVVTQERSMLRFMKAIRKGSPVGILIPMCVPFFTSVPFHNDKGPHHVGKT